MSKEKVISLLLIGFAILAVLYYVGKKKTAALPAPGTGGPAVNAGGAVFSQAIGTPTAGSQGSYPSITAGAAAQTGNIPAVIAQAAALTGQSVASIFQNNLPLVGAQPSTLQQTTSTDLGSQTLVEQLSPTPDLSGLQGGAGWASTDSGVALPDLSGSSSGPDLGSQVTALDAGGLDAGSIGGF